MYGFFFFFFLFEEEIKNLHWSPNSVLNSCQLRLSQMKCSMLAISLLQLVGIQGMDRGNEDFLEVIVMGSFHWVQMVKTLLTALIDISSGSFLLQRILIFLSCLDWFSFKQTRKRVDNTLPIKL